MNGALQATKLYVNWIYCAILGAMAGARDETNTSSLETVVKNDLEVYYKSIYTIAKSTLKGNTSKESAASKKIDSIGWLTYQNDKNLYTIDLERYNTKLLNHTDPIELPPDLDEAAGG